jgi:hypothetical protein
LLVNRTAPAAAMDFLVMRKRQTSGCRLRVVLLICLLLHGASSRAQSPGDIISGKETATMDPIRRPVCARATGRFSRSQHFSFGSHATYEAMWMPTNVPIALVASVGPLAEVHDGTRIMAAALGSSGRGQVSANSDATSTAASQNVGGTDCTLTSPQTVANVGVQAATGTWGRKLTTFQSARLSPARHPG